MDWTAIAVALIGLAGVLGTAAWGGKQRVQLRQAEAEIGFQRQAFDFTRYTKEWGDTFAELMDIQNTSKVDCFQMLVAFNGKYDPRWFSDILQVRNARQSPTSFRHVQADENYVHMLRHIQTHGEWLLEVNDLPDCMLKNILLSEDFQHVFISHIETRERPRDNIAAITFCCFATHATEPFTDTELRKCRVMVNRLKGFAALFDAGRT